MLKVTLLCIAAAAVVPLSSAALAQTPDQGPALPYQGPGVYSTYGNRTYGPNGSIQFNQGNQTYTQKRGGRGQTYSTLGRQTYGSDGSLLNTYGNTTHQNDGTISQTQGNQTYVYKPGGPTVVCSTYGSQQICR